MTEAFEMTIEVHDKAKGARKNLTLPSSTPWADLQNKVAQIFNIYPGSLQLQHCFSNEKPNSLLFHLNSHDAYVKMCDQLRPFVVPKILANRNPSKAIRKLIMVQLFNKDAKGDGVSGRKAAKVRRSLSVQQQATYLYLLMQKSAKSPANTDALMTKQDEIFEKKKVVIEQLTEHRSSKIHSLPDKPALCWTPIKQWPHGNCYPITQSNINFWAFCVVSYFSSCHESSN
jgi:hypothetical protein